MQGRAADGEATVMHTVSISDMKVATASNDALVTYSLGSCIGVSLHDPVAGVGAMVHYMLPLSKLDPSRAKQKPFMFGDTAVPTMLEAVFAKGARRERIVAKVAGGAAILDEKGLFKIGERNYTVLRKILWKNNILTDAEDTGGTVARTMYLHMDTGKTILKINGQESEL